MDNSFSARDFYCVYSDYDISLYTKELNLLYLPLVGSDAVRLYSFFGSKMFVDRNMSKNYLHYDIFDNLSLDEKRFVLARKKLEALGLLKSYYLDNQYVYKIQKVLSFSEFFATPILAQLLENTIGSSEYSELKNYYMKDKVSFSNFEEISAKFSDVYQIENSVSEVLNFPDSQNAGPNFDEYNFDFAKLNYFLASSYLVNIVEDGNVKKDILGLAHLYKVSPQDMAKGIENCVDVVEGRNVLNIEKLKDYLLQLYVNVRKQETPTLDKMLSKKLLEDEGEELSEEDLFIREVDNTSYINYLNKQKNIILSSVDAKSIEKLQEKYNFPTGVLNILLEYAINNSNATGLPHVNYIDKIASSWKAKNLLGARDAIDFIRTSRQNFSDKKAENSTKKATRKATGSYQNKKLYNAPFPEYMKNRMQGLSGTKNPQKRVVSKEAEDAYNQMLKELNNKEG